MRWRRPERKGEITSSRVARSLLIAGFFVLTVAAKAQQSQKLDLAGPAKTDTVRVLPGQYQVRITNFVPQYRYLIAVSRGVESIPPISTAFAQGAVDCPELTKAVKALDALESEDRVESAVRTLQQALSQESSKPECVELVTDARNLLAKTDRTLDDVYTLNAGEFIIVDVARFGDDGKATQRWVRRITTGPIGEWRWTYGYVFPLAVRLSRARPVREGQRYFAKQIGDTGSLYTITEERRSRHFDAVPSAMFVFAPSDDSGLRWDRLTAGLAVDLTKPMVFVGTGVTYNSNLQLSVGASFRQEQVLLGKYSPGDTVKSNLSTEQLHEDAFRLRPFIAVTLRFDRNPFKKEAEAEKTDKTAEKAPDAKPSETKKPDDKKPGAVSPRSSGANGNSP